MRLGVRGKLGKLIIMPSQPRKKKIVEIKKRSQHNKNGIERMVISYRGCLRNGGSDLRSSICTTLEEKKMKGSTCLVFIEVWTSPEGQFKGGLDEVFSSAAPHRTHRAA